MNKNITLDYLFGGGIKSPESQVEASNSLINKFGVTTNSVNFTQSASSGISQSPTNYFGGSPSGGISGSMATGNWKNSGT